MNALSTIAQSPGVCPPSAAGRAEYFPEPEKFDPDRFRPEAEFALLEGHIVVAALAQRIAFEAPNQRAIETEPLILNAATAGQE